MRANTKTVSAAIVVVSPWTRPKRVSEKEKVAAGETPPANVYCFSDSDADYRARKRRPHYGSRRGLQFQLVRIVIVAERADDII